MNASPHILLVEDDTLDVMIFKRALKRAGFEHTLHLAQDGQEALSLLKSDALPQPPDVILMDLNMPRMGGLECLAQIRQDEALSHLSVFIFTTSAASEDLDEAYKLHAAGYIVKEGEITQSVQVAQLLDLYARLNCTQN